MNEPPPSASPPPGPPPPATPPSAAAGAPPLEPAGKARAVILGLNTDPVVVSLVRALLVISVVVLGWYVLAYLATVLWPVVLALAVAYMLDPVLERMVARGFSRGTAARVLLLGFFASMAVIVTVLALFVPGQVQAFIDGAPAMLERGHSMSMEYFAFDLQSHLTTEELQRVLEGALGPLDRIAVVALAETLSVLTIVVELLLVVLFAYYLLLEWPSITRRVMKMVPPRRRTYVLDVLTEIDGVVSGWVRGQAIVTGLLAILYAIAFWIIGLPLAIPLGLVVGGLTIIPFIGTFVGLAITAVVLVLTPPAGMWVLGDLTWTATGGSSATTIVAVAAVFIGLHLLEAAVLTPKIVGHKVGLSESAALFAVLAGGKLLGLIGIILAVPLAATAAVLIRHLVRRYERSSFFGHEHDALVAVTPAMAMVMTQERPDGAVPHAAGADNATRDGD